MESDFTLELRYHNKGRPLGVTHCPQCFGRKRYFQDYYRKNRERLLSRSRVKNVAVSEIRRRRFVEHVAERRRSVKKGEGVVTVYFD